MTTRRASTGLSPRPYNARKALHAEPALRPGASPAPIPCLLWTTRGSDEPAAARAGRFQFDPAERDRSFGLDMLIAYR
jgi:hypothetical protein